MTELESSIRQQAYTIADSLPPAWGRPLTASLRAQPNAGYARDIAYNWRRAWLLAGEPSDAPTSLAPAQWAAVRLAYASRPGRSGRISPRTVTTFCSCLRAVLFHLYPGGLPRDLEEALPATQSGFLPVEQRPSPGRPASKGDSLLRADAADRRHARAILAKLPAAWQGPLAAFLDDLDLRGKAASSGLAGARAWAKAAGSFPPESLPASLSVAAWQQMTLSWLRQPNRRDPSRTVERNSVSSQAGYVRTILKYATEGLELSKPVKRALSVPLGTTRLKGKVIDQAQFNALLEAAATEPQANHPHQVAAKLALLWGVWDAGGRISEILSLNLSGAALSSAGGLLRMHKMPRQKSGPRDIAVTESAGPLLAWMEVHPGSASPSSPLFCNLYSKTGSDRMSYATACDLFARWRERAGLPLVDGKPYRWHDMRHTRATRMARQKMDPAMKNTHFGWSPGSTMGARYSHISADDILQVLRRDVGIDDLGFRQMMDAGDDLGALKTLLKKLLGDGLAVPTRPTPEHQRR